ncbi:MAG: photosynthetic complex assembly protein PuhC [Myxococcales bacterium]|nr:photosynthetic complex assembly protein PuhC [Myxococcales bacterium]
MAAHHHDQKIPRGVLIGAAVLMAATFILAATSRRTLVEAQAQPQPPPVESLELSFVDQPGGGLAVIERSTGRTATLLQPTTNNFVRGVLRGMFRERKLESLGRDAVFTLARHADGRLTLEDQQTHRRVDLNAFGPDNTAAFVMILDAGRQVTR